MALIPFEPMRHMENWKRDLDRLFNEGFPSGFGMFQEFVSPRIDVYETDHEVVAHCEIAGLEKKEDVHLHVENQALTIHGNIQRANEIKEDRLHRRERFAGRFQRTVSLPAPVSAEGTTATYKNGVLEVRMPKAKPDNHKQIDIQFH